MCSYQLVSEQVNLMGLYIDPRLDKLETKLATLSTYHGKILKKIEQIFTIVNSWLDKMTGVCIEKKGDMSQLQPKIYNCQDNIECGEEQVVEIIVEVQNQLSGGAKFYMEANDLMGSKEKLAATNVTLSSQPTISLENLSLKM